MLRILIFLIIPFLSYSQNWNQVANFSGDGRHHPAYGSYLNDMFKYDKSNDTYSFKIFHLVVEDTRMV